jgi:hypothetical protein
MAAAELTTLFASIAIIVLTVVTMIPRSSALQLVVEPGNVCRAHG